MLRRDTQFSVIDAKLLSQELPFDSTLFDLAIVETVRRHPRSEVGIVDPHDRLLSYKLSNTSGGLAIVVENVSAGDRKPQPSAGH